MRISDWSSDVCSSDLGRQKYVISLEPIEGEITEKNNTSTIFIEVLDRRRKILLLGAAPHPDLGALKQALESGQQYEVVTRLAEETQDTFTTGSYSLIILPQLPADGHPVPASLRNISGEKKLPVWHIIGNQTDMVTLGRPFTAAIDRKRI